MKYCTTCKTNYEDTVGFCPVHGEVLEDDPSSIVGTVLDGQYQVESLLGKGGMGAVYLARHILLGDRVAIKILPPEVRQTRSGCAVFKEKVRQLDASVIQTPSRFTICARLATAPSTW